MLECSELTGMCHAARMKITDSQEDLPRDAAGEPAVKAVPVASLCHRRRLQAQPLHNDTEVSSVRAFVVERAEKV